MSLGPDDLVAAANSLKTVYTDDELVLKISKDHPFFAAIEKRNAFVGKTLDHSVQYGFNQSAGPTVAVSEATNSTMNDMSFSVPRQKYFGYGEIERELILASREKKGAFARNGKRAMDNAIDSLTLYLMWNAWGNGGNAYGRLAKVGVADGLLNTQVQLANPDMSNWIEKDMQLQFSVNTGFGAVTTVKQAGGGAEGSAATGITLTVSNVLRRTGLITFTTAVPVAAGEVAVNDYIFRRQTKGLGLSGIRAWNPMNDTDAAATLHGGVRANDVERLGGMRYLNPSGTYSSTILDAAAYAKNMGANLRQMYMNPISITRLSDVERSRTTREEIGPLEIGFDVIKFSTSVGVLDTFSESAIPPGWAYVTNTDDWEFAYLGEENKPVEFFKEAGLLWRVPGTDRLGFHLGGYGNFLHHKPVNGLWIKLDAAAVEI